MLVPAYMYLAKTRSPFLHHSVSTTISFIQIAPGLLCSVKLCKRLADARRPGYLFFFFSFLACIRLLYTIAHSVLLAYMAL